MMPLTQNFSINVDRIVHETIDGETIIIHLETGTYYSLAGLGAEIWAMLASGSSTDDVVEELQRRYEASPEQLSGAIAELVRELQTEGLLEDNSDAAQRRVTKNGAGGNDFNGARASFDPPTLKKYTDMQYFLLLDPIHEVDDIGWPNPPSDEPAQ